MNKKQKSMSVMPVFRGAEGHAFFAHGKCEKMEKQY